MGFDPFEKWLLICAIGMMVLGMVVVSGILAVLIVGALS